MNFRQFVLFGIAIAVCTGCIRTRPAQSKNLKWYPSNGNDFIDGQFKLGIDYNYYTNHGTDLQPYDYVSIWMNTIDSSGSTAWNPWYQGVMLDVCVQNGKIPLFYAYVTAFEARAMWGLQDCDVNNGQPTLCQKGSEFIRQNRQHLIEKYAEHAGHIAEKIGGDGLVVFVMEPDFWQYYGDSNTQENGALDGDYMRDLFDDFVYAIKTELPNALISWDISAWIGEDGFNQWWSFFQDSEIDFIHTSGGQAHGELSDIKPNELSWSFVSWATGKQIIADCGYGVAGGSSDNCGVWADSNNQNARINDGVVALSVATVNGWVQKPAVDCC